MEAAYRLSPDNPLYLARSQPPSIGSDNSEALANVTDAVSRNSDRYTGGSKAADLAVMVMAERQLGRHEQAKGTLARLRETMRIPQWGRDVESQDFLRKAEMLVKESGNETRD